MHKRLLFRAEDRAALRRLGIWVEWMMLIAGSILLGVLIFA
ncbi:hypothetical protein [Microbulbifer agarilyticus]|nr:hypothetical protein [Microbulbifer agarilyticus]